jgi:diguanylate cyclase (GGDEF)-like protein
MKQLLDKSFLGMSRLEKDEFYKNQFEYYRKFNTSIVIVAVLASFFYFISDCQLFGRFAYETLVPRMSTVIDLVVFLFIRKYNHSYKVEMLASQLIGHLIMWHTIWAIYYLPNRQYCSDGFLIMQIVILMLGFASSFGLAVISQLLIIVNILISNMFIHYEDVDLMISLGLPLAIGIAISNYIFTQSYYNLYKTTKELEKLSYLDQLTGAFNRHKISKLIEDDKFIVHTKDDISIVILDIDLFKKVNDTYGHDKGDIILKYLSKTLKASTTADDLVVRWGGEEFLLILFGYDEENAARLANNIRETVEFGNNGISNITISLGICQYKDSYIGTVKKADMALYYAKEHGRNKAIRYSDIEEA